MPRMPTFNPDGTYEWEGKTYYLTDIHGRGFISDTGVYRLEVNVTAIPAELSKELFIALRDAAISFLQAKEALPADVTGVEGLVRTQPLDS